MKRVISFNIEKRKRDALLAFFKAVITASQSDEKVTAMCSMQLQALVEAYNLMQELAERHQMNLLTPEVQAADGWRDANLTRFRAAVRSELKNPDPAKKAAAELLWKICEELGRVHNQAYDEQSGAITIFCLDLEKNHHDEMELLGVTDSFQLLKSANEEFIRILAERTGIDGSIDKGASQKARAEAVTAYRDFVMKINTLVVEGHYDELAMFTDYLNAEIERQRIALGQRPGNTGEDDEEEGAPKYKFATFVYVGGTEMKFKVEVGTPLIAPDNTEGYRWDPEVPALMPKTNKTFCEVPIEENSENSELDPAENIKIVFKNQFNQPVHEVIVPVDYQMTEEEYPTPPEGTHWNFTLADLNLAIGMKEPGDTITVRAQA